MKALVLLVLAVGAASVSRADPGNRLVMDIPSTREAPRNSEGAFINLRSGRIQFYYSQFYGGQSDFSAARIARISSDDGGRTWSQPEIFSEKGAGVNLMSVSLLRLKNGKIAMFWMNKKNGLDCRPYLSISSDEAATWSAPTPILVPPGYYVLNNDRVVQTASGRLIAPLALRVVDESRFAGDNLLHSDAAHWIVLWYHSDDDGATWRQSRTWWAMPVPSASGLQEPGVVPLADQSLFSWARTDQGCQYGFTSRDDGLTWSAPEPTSLRSPASPASIKRLPDSSTLLAVFNDHSGRFPYRHNADPYAGRAPLVVALSYDGGRTWPVRRAIESDVDTEYAYTAIGFEGDQVLLAYSVGRPGHPHLGELCLRRIALPWLRGLAGTQTAPLQKRADIGVAAHEIAE